ncbi:MULTISPECIES: site-specific integrase [unclassified Blastomonas]|uniref:tyrosine-type recombinase/integrase n=2 Tax=Sphingomonadales TaxID=204457 RepID=UPI001E54740F|nr:MULTISPECIES: site-specific integrase [unclassified Blastomonas]
MGKTAIKSVRALSNALGRSVAVDGYAVPNNSQNFGTLGSSSDIPDGHMVPAAKKQGNRAFLDGNFARRNLPLKASEYCIWDTELAGFGLRVRPTGNYYWFVRLRHRGKHRRITLGKTTDLDAALARSQARRLLAEVALDGLPKRVVVRSTPTMNDFVATYFEDLSRVWKASTAKRNADAWRGDLAPHFGDILVADVTKADVVRWRDACAGEREARYNRAIPVLAALLNYAEALKMRRKGSNPCRGMPRYKRQAMERYLTPREYARVGAELRAQEAEFPAQVAILRLLLFTGARRGEIEGLRWDWVKPPRLVLPDSKTGPKVIWLNSQALAVLEGIARVGKCPYVFPDRTGTKPISLEKCWENFRRRCALPDVRLHDLRHSFASTAIMDDVPLATIGKLLGHVLPETTAKYAHLADEIVADAAKRISGSLANSLGLHA